MDRARKQIVRAIIRTAFAALTLLACGLPSANAQSWLDQFRPAAAMEETGEIETDRDSFTPATTLTPHGRTIFESAWTWVDNRDAKDTHSLPEVLLRHGVTERIELRFGTNYEIGGEASHASGSHGGGRRRNNAVPTGDGLHEEANVSYGVKFDTSDQSHWIPDSSLIVTGATPTSGEEAATRLVATYVFGWELENGWIWDSAIRYGLTGEGSEATNSWSPSTVVKFPMGERAKGHVEYFSILSDTPDGQIDKHYVSPGVHYLITEELEIGVRVGWGLNDSASDFFSNVGIGWLY